MRPALRVKGKALRKAAWHKGGILLPGLGATPRPFHMRTASGMLNYTHLNASPLAARHPAELPAGESRAAGKSQSASYKKQKKPDFRPQSLSNYAMHPIMREASEIVILFFIYSVLGWVWESIYCSIKAGRFIYRGFLMGPYCPVYGFGVLIVLYIVKPLHETPLDLFVFSAIAVTALEYFTALLLERAFGVSLWNYDNMPLNIQGRVAVPVSIFWGFCCVMVVNYIQPEAAMLSGWIYGRFGIWPAALIAAAMAADAAYSAAAMTAFGRRAGRLAAELRGRACKAEVHAWKAAAEISEKLRDADRRILNAFPDLKVRAGKFSDAQERPPQKNRTDTD